MKWLSIELSLLLLVSLVAFAGFASLQSSDNDLTGEAWGSWYRPPPRIYVPTPAPRPTVCAQVITFAKNPQTGECRKFSNACIPAGWSRVRECPKPKPTLAPPPTLKQCTQIKELEKVSDFTADLTELNKRMKSIADVLNKYAPHCKDKVSLTEKDQLRRNVAEFKRMLSQLDELTLNIKRD